MKKENALKFTLTIAASVLLAACGGGSNGGNVEANKAVNPSAEELAAQQKAALEAQLKTEADQTQVIGNKIVNKTDSDVSVYVNNGLNVAGKPTNLVVAGIDPSFDTLVVGTRTFNGSTESLYLEDLRTDISLDTDATGYAASATNGVAKLKGVYVTNKAKKDGAESFSRTLGQDENETDVSADRTDADDETLLTQVESGDFKRSGDKNLNEYGKWTKTDTKGTKDADVLVYKTTDQDGSGVYFVQKGKSAGRLQGDLDQDHLKNQVGEYNSVAELYGRATTSKDYAKFNSDKGAYDVADGKANLPLFGDDVGGKSKKASGSRLQYVQYGRVTVALDSDRVGSDFAASFKKGIDVGGNLKTYVVPYAQFNTEGSKEDHYFFRGIDTVTAANLAKYGFNTTDAKGKDIEVTYKGHAVTYGLDNAYHNSNQINVPSALHGITPEVAVSGTHVAAKVNLTTRKVNDGELYNVYQINGKNEKDVLVKFNGDLKANGNAVGTSELYYNGTVKDDAVNKAGTFAATLFGNKGLADTELGGVVASNNAEKDYKWGAVFGAKPIFSGIGIADNSDALQGSGSNPGSVSVDPAAVNPAKQTPDAQPQK